MLGLGPPLLSTFSSSSSADECIGHEKKALLPPLPAHELYHSHSRSVSTFFSVEAWDAPAGGGGVSSVVIALASAISRFSLRHSRLTA